MATLANDQAARRWVQSWTRGAGAGPDTKVSYAGSSIRLNRSTGELIYHRTARLDRTAWGPVTLARFLPEHKTFLLNGDGFTDSFATGAQDQLRAIVRDEIDRVNPSRPRNTSVFQVILIPYLALTGAEIDPETVRPVVVEADRWENTYHEIRLIPPKKAWRITGRRPTDARRNEEFERTYEASRDGLTFHAIVRQERTWTHRTTRRVVRWNPYGERHLYEERIAFPEPGQQTFINAIQVLATHTNGAARWVRLDSPQRRERTTRRDDAGNPVQNYGWWERIHHLGASVFDAVGEDGKRHRFISAFDEQETNQMYYLAQLPDKAQVATYAEAVAALAPPIVHAARAKGRNVRRQGDIFAIESKLTDEQVYAQARTRVRREIALFDTNTTVLRQIFDGRLHFPEVVKSEVSERVLCPCRCGHRRTIGWGAKAKRALMIYGTAHTATEVVVWKNGATFVRGTMHHDPQLESPGRRREHVDVPLGEDVSVWHLACRNTVPRRSASRRQRRAADAAQNSVVEQEEVAA